MTKDVQRLSEFYQNILQTTSDCDDEVHQEIHTQGAFLAILKYDDANGVEILDEPTIRPWGAKNMRFCDPDGNYIVFRSFLK